jgi:CHRD domain-containing protein
MRSVLLAGVVAVGLVPTALAAFPLGTMQARLSGRGEVPMGLTRGSGSATVRITGPRRVCWTFKLSGVTAPTAAHIHRGVPGRAGPIVIPLGKTYAATGCTAARATAVTALAKHPRRFYVNVHNARYPGGAVRGQLHKLG